MPLIIAEMAASFNTIHHADRIIDGNTRLNKGKHRNNSKSNNNNSSNSNKSKNNSSTTTTNNNHNTKDNYNDNVNQSHSSQMCRILSLPPMNSLPFLLFVCSLVCSVHCATAGHIFLSPLEGKPPIPDGKDAMVVIIPEVGVPSSDYVIFGRIIQQMYPLRLSIGIIDTIQERQLTLNNLPLILAEVKQQLSLLAGSKGEGSVFLAAHGQRGSLAADYARAVPESLSGLILYGAFLPRRWRVVTFPLPVLTISGDLDGVTRMTRIAETIRQLMADAEFDPSIVVHSPLVLLEGGNHNSYTTGRLPEGLHMLDIEEEVDKSISMETAANMTSLFVARTLESPASFVPIAESTFRECFEYAKNVTEPIRSLRELTQDNNYKSYWVKFAQKWLSGLAGKDSTHLDVDSYIVVDHESLQLPPALVVEDGMTYVVTFSDINQADRSDASTPFDDEEDNPTAPQAPGEIAARMLGPERIQKFLKNTTIAHNYTCQDLNYGSFMTAYHTASELARTRFDSYKRSVIFAPDVMTDVEELWEKTSLKITMEPSEIHVTSIAYKTPADDSQSIYSGLFFCKLLPPDRALEWIYVDALRRNLPLKR